MQANEGGVIVELAEHVNNVLRLTGTRGRKLDERRFATALNVEVAYVENVGPLAEGVGVGPQDFRF